MKKRLLAMMFCALVCATYTIAQVRLDLHPLSTKGLGHDIKRTPALIPEVWLDGNMLLFPLGINDSKVEIYKGGILVYDKEISDEIETLEIPDYIEGSLELYILKGTVDYIAYLIINNEEL